MRTRTRTRTRTPVPALAFALGLTAPALALAGAAPLPACKSVGARGDRPQSAEQAAASLKARGAAQRGLDFLGRAALAWQKQHQCNGCHVQSVTLEAMSVGLHNQYRVPRPSVQAIADGMLNLSGGGRKPGGLSYQQTTYLGSAKSFGGAAFARYDQWVDGDLRHDLLQVAGELLAFQEQDGSVRSDYPSNLPVSVGPVQRAYQAAQTWRQAYARTADDRWLPPLQRAEAYLQRTARTLQQQPGANVQEINYALLGLAAAGVGWDEPVMTALRGRVLQRQNHDGGWGYLDKEGSNAFATGQSLYALRQLGLSDKDGPIERGTAWLVQHQAQDGGWGGGGFGKAEAMWGVLGLVSVDVVSIAIGGLSDGGRVEGKVQVDARARDNDEKGAGVAQVELRIDDLPVERACGDKLRYAWDASKLATGKHTVDLWATNGRGQVSRRRLEVYAGDIYLTQIGTDAGADGLDVSLRNIAPKAGGTVELQILRAGDKGQPEGAALATVKQPGAAGPMHLRWDGKGKDGKAAPAGKYFARILYSDGQVRQREDVLFVRDTKENQQKNYGEIQGQLRMKAALSQGAPAAAANAMVDLVDDRGNVVQSVRSTAEGQYRFRNVDEGKYKVRVRKDGFAPAERPVAAKRAAEAAAPLDL